MRQFLRGAIAGGVGAAVVMVTTAAMAGTGIGGVFNLGKTNTAQENDLSPSASMSPVAIKGAGTVGQARLLLHYTTTSGFFVIQHVATVDAAAHETGGTSCTFVASTVAGATGRFAP